MADTHNAIKYGSVLSGIARVAGLGENEEGVSRLSETLQPILELERSDKQFPQSIGLGFGRISVAAGAVPSYGKLFCPNIETVLYDAYVQCQNDTAAEVQVVAFRVHTAVAVAASPTGTQSGDRALLDTRAKLILPIGEVWGGGAVAHETNTTFFAQLLAAKAITDWLGPFVVSARNQVGMAITTAVAGRFNFKWRERHLLRGELRP